MALRRGGARGTEGCVCVPGSAPSAPSRGESPPLRVLFRDLPLLGGGAPSVYSLFAWVGGSLRRLSHCVAHRIRNVGSVCAWICGRGSGRRRFYI